MAKLVKAHGMNRKGILCIFEGDDAKYYGIRIDNHISLERRNVQCKGKETVIALREKAMQHPELKNANTLFFVDQDFDDIEIEANLYVTPCYSIENLYATNSALSRLLNDEFELNDVDHTRDIENVLACFDKVNTQFNKCMLPFNSWFKIQIKESEINQEVKLNANNVDLNKLVNVTLNDVSTKYSIENIKKLFPDTVDIISENLDKMIVIFNNYDLSSSSRGKYRLEFFRLWLECLMDDARNEKSVLFNKKFHPKLSLSKKNILSELSQYADTPVCLKKFLTDCIRTKSKTSHTIYFISL
ncbi:DUF4435 domain-containing protein [Candidatus Halobeggiatoa sp. HSG11]|nr:DUF4435 domain-containing protein [Candidatus Halobeggiatoa sp. HSG11]